MPLNIRGEGTQETFHLRGRIFVLLDALPKDILKQNPLARALVELNQHVITCAAWFFPPLRHQTVIDHPFNSHGILNSWLNQWSVCDCGLLWMLQAQSGHME